MHLPGHIPEHLRQMREHNAAETHIVPFVVLLIDVNTNVVLYAFYYKDEVPMLSEIMLNCVI